MIIPNRRYYLAAISIVLLIAWWSCLPKVLFRDPYSTVLLDKNGELLGARIAPDGQWRFPGDELQLPETFRQAVIQFEDKNFEKHIGVDFPALGRAMRDNMKAGKVVSGGSTITMQAMRLARKGRDRNLFQKFVETLWALRAEVRYSKNEIMQLYAAHAPFGGNVVGLEAASWIYFQKSPSELSWGEAATLAVLPNAPGLIHPGRNRNALQEKRNRLLQKMMANGIIDETEASLAMQEPIPQEPQQLPDLAPHLLGHYQREGNILHSTLDLHLQVRLADLLQRHADINALNGVHNAALMVMKTMTGEVVAYIGNVSDEQKNHQNDVDIIRSERSSGSILKPFLYCAAMEAGLITPQGIVEDIPTYVRGYQPLNFTREYMGMVPSDDALAMSLNVPLVRLLRDYGILPFKEKLRKAGITTLHYSADHYGLPLILGGAEITLWDICGAYASMGRVLENYVPYGSLYAKDDIFPPVAFVNRHNDKKNGKTSIKKKLVSEAPIWNAGAVWHTFEAMSTLRRPDQEGQWETFESSKRIAWKTGTSFGYRDAWAIGLTPEYTIGVWVGNADGEGRPGVIGLHAAAPVLFDVLRMLEDHSGWWLTPYESMTYKPLCSESGWIAGSQCQTIDSSFLPIADLMPKICDYHTTCYVNREVNYRFNPDCDAADLEVKTYFTVPALAETYYKRYNPAYVSLPPLAPGCSELTSRANDMAIVYPRNGSKIYVPYEWDRKRSRAVFSAVHRSDTVNIFWHLDKKFLGRTKEFHQIEIDPAPGLHQLVLQDEYGSLVTTVFEVLSGGND